jgi:hypothetical protein
MSSILPTVEAKITRQRAQIIREENILWNTISATSMSSYRGMTQQNNDIVRSRLALQAGERRVVECW